MKDQKQYITELVSFSEKGTPDLYSQVNFLELYAPFEGFPKRHPSDKGMILLFSDPFTDETHFYEFPAHAVGRIEEMGSISKEDGSTGLRVRIWIRKGTRGLLSRSVIVE